jgi:hypothetical protein
MLVDGSWADADAAGHEVEQPGVAAVGVAQLVGERDEVGPPVPGRWPAQVELARDGVGHELQQLVAGVDVAVQRRGSRAECRGDPAHRDGREAVRVGERDRGGGDPGAVVLGGRAPSGPLRAQPDAARPVRHVTSLVLRTAYPVT